MWWRAPTKSWCAKGRQDCVFAFHDGDEVGPKMLVRIARHTGLRVEEL